MEARWKRNPHRKKVSLDLFHIVLCILVVGLSVYAFMDVENRAWAFPIVFVASAILDLVNGYYRFHRGRSEENAVIPALLLVFAGVFLLLLAASAFYVLWRQGKLPFLG